MAEETKYDYDFFCIGGGSGGVRASRVASKHGAKVGLCEEWKLGGTCVIRGCVPKKILWYGANFNKSFQYAKNFGWNVKVDPVDYPKLAKNKSDEVERLNGIYHRLLDGAGVEFFAGHGKLLDAHTVQVGDKKFTSKYILICTGSAPWMPKIEGIEYAINSNGALDLTEAPKDMIIVGGGYIASEFAAIFHNLGVKVTQIYRGDKLLRTFDEDIRDIVSKQQIDQGINVAFGTNITKIEKLDNGRFKCTLDNGDPIETEVVFYATGRLPNVTDLGLENAGVEVGRKNAIKVDDYSKTNVDSIYAVGDVTDRINLTPVALEEGHAVADSLFGNNKRFLDHDNVASAVFTMPPVGSCGLSEQDAIKKYGEDGLDYYYTDFRPMMHTISQSGVRTMMKLLVVKETQLVIGVHIVGEGSPDMIQLAGVAMKCGATKQQFDATVGVHPTSAEELVTMRTQKTSYRARMEAKKNADK